MIKLLQGRPLKHPLHPFLVHFPIALFTLSLLLDVIGKLWPELEEIDRISWFSMVAGVAMALIAALPGFADFTSIRKDHPAKKIAITHMILNLAVVLLYAINGYLRYIDEFDGTIATLPFILSLIAFGMLAFSGHLGGKMVFDDGISVGRHRRETDLPDHTINGKEKIGDHVIIAEAAALKEGGTLRAEVNGTVMTIARVNGEFFAFQEFCTHRFGPLSEGCIHNGEIECPWHKSRFDIRTGLVTEGPAKEKLKTFPIKVIDGKIAVATT